jgi:hypothetical protein
MLELWKCDEKKFHAEDESRTPPARTARLAAKFDVQTREVRVDSMRSVQISGQCFASIPPDLEDAVTAVFRCVHLSGGV